MSTAWPNKNESKYSRAYISASGSPRRIYRWRYLCTIVYCDSVLDLDSTTPQGDGSKSLAQLPKMKKKKKNST